MKNGCFETVVLEKTLESPLDFKIKPVNPKGNQSWMFIERTDAEAPIIWPPDSLEKTLKLGKIESRRRSGWQRMRWLDSITNSVGMNWSKLQETVEDRGAWCAISHGVTKSWMQVSNWTITTTSWGTCVEEEQVFSFGQVEFELYVIKQWKLGIGNERSLEFGRKVLD